MAAFCKEYHVSPTEFRNTYADDIDMLLMIAHTVKDSIKEEQDRKNRTMRNHGR